MRITIFRHAQSTHNASGVHTLNCPLSRYGIDQARKINGTFDHVILSPLRRARQTYDFSKIKSGGITVSNLFREYHPLGHPTNFLEKERVTLETPEQLRIRVNEAMKFLKTLPYKNIGVISHHDFIAEFSKIVNNGNPIYLPNTGHLMFNII